jgi:signal transduction histidine kinase
LHKVARLNALLLDSLPYPAMMIRWDRLVLEANRIAQQMGARVGGYCWQNFRLDQHSNCPHDEDGECRFCLAGDAFQSGEAINSHELAVNGRIWDVWWIPIDREVCLHYAIDITERKRAEYSLRILSRFLEIANRYADMPSLLQAFVQELISVTCCSAVAVWVLNSEGNEPFIAGQGCDLKQLTADPARIKACEPPAESRTNDRPPPVPGIPSTTGSAALTSAPTAQEQGSRSGRPSDAVATAWIPVRLEERILGAIYLGGPKEGLLSTETIDIVDTAAMKLAAAVERILSKERLEKSEQTLRFLSNRLMSAQEEERTRISRELHDSIGSSLCAIRLSIENVMQEESDLKSLEKIVALTQGTMEEVRRIMTDLRPSVLDDLGIIAALRWFCRQFKGLHSGIEVVQQVDIQEDEVPEPLKIVIFRIVQESFNNVAKYSQADVVTLSLARKEGAIQLSIHDNGNGFDPMSVAPRKGLGSGIGLTSMQERTELSGGAFSLASCQGEGTRVAASWPLLRQ